MQTVASSGSGQDDSPRCRSDRGDGKDRQELQTIGDERDDRVPLDVQQCDPGTNGLSLALEERELWTRFQCITNEMIVTKNGRCVRVLFSSLVYIITKFEFSVYIKEKHQVAVACIHLNFAARRRHRLIFKRALCCIYLCGANIIANKRPLILSASSKLIIHKTTAGEEPRALTTIKARIRKTHVI